MIGRYVNIDIVILNYYRISWDKFTKLSKKTTSKCRNNASGVVQDKAE